MITGILIVIFSLHKPLNNLKHTGGCVFLYNQYMRPSKYTSVEQIDKLCKEYMRQQTHYANGRPKKKQSIPTILGLRNHVGISSYLLSEWKRSENKLYVSFFEVIHAYEDEIIAIYESIIANSVLLSGFDKVDIKGLMWLMRAYRKEQYAPELFTYKPEEQKQETPTFILDIKQPTKKGEQNAGIVKLIDIK